MSDQKSKISTFRELCSFLKPHWRVVAIGVFAQITVAIMALIPPQLRERYLIDKVLTDLHSPIALRLERLIIAVAALVAVLAASALIDRRRTVLMHTLGEKFILDLRRRIYYHLQKLSLTYFETRQTGEVMSRVTNDSDVVEEFVTHATDILISDVLKALGIVAILFYWNPFLALVAFVPMPITTYITYKYSRKVRGIWRATRERLAEMNARLQDSLSGIRVIKSFAREDYEYDRFAREAEEVYDMRVNVIKMWTGFFRLITVSSGIGIYTVLAVGGWIHITNPSALSLGTLFAFAAYIGMFYQPVSNIARVNDTIQRALAAADRIFEVLHTEPDLVDAPDAIEMPPIKGAVTFENVSFAYSSGEEVLKDINLHAEPGQIIAIVGRSGAGKTSFVNLIPRFYDPTRGRVLIDGIDIRTVTQQSLRRQIGMVLQDTFLFNGTVRENLLYGKLDATEEEIIEAAKAAYADSFIREMPNGYDTEIGERGIKLSGGQKQRIAIARAILADPRIMILDEATSSVDSESEYYIHRAMDQLMQGRTTFVIAHRLSTIRHADIIVTLESGRVVEIGDHNTLMERSGTYSHLYEAQYRFEDELE
mgnify:CR=1 FL=1